MLKVGGASVGTTSVVNGLSEFPPSPAYVSHAGFGETSPKRFARRRAGVGGPITWTVDYVYAGRRLLAVVRPAAGTLDTLQVRMKYDLRLLASGHRLQAAMPSRVTRPEAWRPKPEAASVTGLTATPASGYVFVGWTGTGCASGTVQMSQATTCTATFGHRLTVAARLKSGSPYTDVQWTSSPAGINCWTGCAANFSSGTVVTLSTSEMPSSWSGDCSLHQSLTMDGDKTCIAIFNTYLGPVRLGARAPTAGSATAVTASVAPPLETAAPGGGSGPAVTSSAVASAESGAAVVTTSMATPTTLQVVEYYHLDAIGSVRAVTDADGTVIARHDFQPFGEELSPQNPPHDRKLFTGQERDFETGLDYFYARQLRTDLGRFTAPDPMADLAWTDPTLGATNAYGYALNSPLRFIDPSGAQSSEDKVVVVVKVNRVTWADGNLWIEMYPGMWDCLTCASATPIGTLGTTFQSGTTWHNGPFPDVQWSSVTQPQSMGALQVAFFAGQGPTGPGAGSGEGGNVANNGAKQFGVCLAKGAAVGAASALAVGALAVGAVAVGAPVAAVTGVLGVLAVAGGAALGYDVIGQIRSSNWAGLAYDAGSVFGGAAVGGVGGRAIAEGINGVPSPPWSLGSDWSQRYNPGLGSPGQWLGTGPNPGSAGGAATATGAGVAQALRSGC